MTAPLRAAYHRRLRNDNPGVGASQGWNSTELTTAVSPYPHTSTPSAFQQQHIGSSLSYRQETMVYQQVPAEPPRDWQTNASTDFPGPSQYPSRPPTSNPPALQSRHQSHQPPRDNGVGMDFAPQYTSGEGERPEGPDCCEVIGNFLGDALSGLGDGLSATVSCLGSCLKECCCNSKGELDIPCCCPCDD